MIPGVHNLGMAKVRQATLRAGAKMTSGFIEARSDVKVGTVLTLKDGPGDPSTLWTVDSLGQPMERLERKTWKVGGLA